MSDPKSPVVMINADELEDLRLAAGRYHWLRERAVRIQGSEIWYAGSALDYRVDAGRHHLAIQGEQVVEPAALPRRPQHQPKGIPKQK